MKTDPIPSSFDAQNERKSVWWYAMAERFHTAKSASQKRKRAAQERLDASLQANDWGSSEEPGETLWALRYLISQADKSSAIRRQIADFLDRHESLPDHAADLWSMNYFRSSNFKSWFTQAAFAQEEVPADQITVERERLVRSLLRLWPDLIRWQCQSPEVLEGTSATGTIYRGQAWKSPLAWLSRPNPHFDQTPWPGALDLALSLYPLEGLDLAVAQATYAKMAASIPAFLAQVLQGTPAEDVRVSNYDRVKSEISLLEMFVQRRDLTGFNRYLESVHFDPKQMDAYGQSLFHITLATQKRNKKVGDTWEAMTTAEFSEAMQITQAFWQRLAELGVDPEQPCQPQEPPRMSKVTGKPVRGDWPKRAAWPGETPMAMIQRQIAAIKGDRREPEFLPESVFNAWREFQLTQIPKSPSPTTSSTAHPPRRRQRS